MIEDGRNSQKKAWKAFQANYDYVFSQSDRYCSVCITQQQVAALLAMTEYLTWPTRWVSSLGDVDTDKLDAFTSDLETRLMGCCGDDNIPIQYRYTDDGTLQRSLNGGGTWIDCPEFDPRVYSPQFPPLSGEDGDDKKCAAATSAVMLIKEQIGEQLTDDMSRYTLAQLITDWVKTFLESSNPFLALLTVLANQIFALVISALIPALTDTVYDQLQCILFCNMGDDATIFLAQWQQIRSDITDQIGGIAGIFFEHLVFLLGTTGLTNLVRSGAASSGDCSDCGCSDSCDTEAWVDKLDVGSTYGHITARTSDTVTLECHAVNTDGNYYGNIWTGPAGDIGCYLLDGTNFEFTEGTASFAFREFPSTGAVGGIFVNNKCVNWLQPVSGAPFTVIITFAQCAP